MKNYLFAAGLALAAIAATAGTAAAQQNYCDGVARDYANRYAGGNALGGAAVGGAMGAVGGAILGGIINGNRGAGTGAIIGGTGGAIIGGTQGGRQWQALYDQAFNDCMVRSTRPVAGPQGAPPAWTREWYQYCSARYRTFNSDTGYYTAKGGRQAFCR